MNNIKGFLDGFKNKILSSQIEKEIIVRVFNKILNINILKEDIDIKKETIFVKVNPYIKSEIFLNKDKILKEIKKQGIEKTVKDIK